jgi:hypothetical protein
MNIMQISLVTFLFLIPLVFQRTLSSVERIVLLARQEPQNGNETIQWVDIKYSGCNDENPRTGNRYSKDIANAWDEATCITQFLAAMNRCDQDTLTKKYGQHPMTGNSSGGCVDFWLVGHDAGWSCGDGDLDPPECLSGARKGQ